MNALYLIICPQKMAGLQSQETAELEHMKQKDSEMPSNKFISALMDSVTDGVYIFVTKSTTRHPYRRCISLNMT